MNTTIEVCCKSCGSRKIAHEQGYLVQSLVSEWGREEDGTLRADSFAGVPRVMWNSDIGDGGFVCMDCGKEFIDLDEDTQVNQEPVRAFHGGGGEEIRDAARDVLQAWRKRSFRVHELMDELEKVIGNDGVDDHMLQRFDVTYRFGATDSEVEVFRCQAEDAEHAIEQAMNADPDAMVIEVKPVREARVDLKVDDV